MNALLRLFIDFAQHKGIINNSYLVGGTVRDLLIAKTIHDIDITIIEDADNIAKTFADSISASFVMLDKDFGIIRVAKDDEFIDFCRLKGDSIESDLSARDFTINAMAINLSHYANLNIANSSDIRYDLIRKFVIDTFDGLTDLKYKIIRMISESNLAEDPLRLLRAYRFALRLDFSIDINTYHAICRLSPLISKVAVERIAEELRHILRHKFSYKTIRDMGKSGLLVNIFPEIQDIAPELLHYNIRSYTYLEHILNNLSLYFSNYSGFFANYFSYNYKIIGLKFAILFSPGQLAESISLRLKMSKKEIKFIQIISGMHDRFLSLKNSDRSKKIEFLRQIGDELYPLLIFTIAKELICCPNQNPVFLFCLEMLEICHFEIIPKSKLLPILTGDDLMREFHLTPSPLFKYLLDTIESLFLQGKICNKQEALHLIDELLKGGSIKRAPEEP